MTSKMFYMNCISTALITLYYGLYTSLLPRRCKNGLAVFVSRTCFIIRCLWWVLSVLRPFEILLIYQLLKRHSWWTATYVYMNIFVNSVELFSYKSSINILACAIYDVNILQIFISDDWNKYIFIACLYKMSA